MPALLTLITDFGTSDHFVGAVKGVLLAAAPEARLVDVTHEIPPQDVRAAAFTLLAVYPCFPPGTIHLAVVDPGVGSARRPVVLEAGGHRFVGPDNGLFSYVLDREPDARVYHLADSRFFRTPVSPTFHGRDVFAPVAAALARGASAEAMGPPVPDPVRLAPLLPRDAAGGVVEGLVLHVDRFGNCITNLTPGTLPGEPGAAGARLELGGREIASLHRFFAEAREGEPFAYWGSAGFLEVAVRDGHAARTLGVSSGDRVTFRPGASR